MRARLHDLSRGLDGGYLLTISTREDVRGLFDDLREKDLDVDLKKHREKRSLNANAYLWQLLSKLAECLDTTKEELYRHYVTKVGPHKDFELTENEAATFRVAWERLGVGWLTERVDYTPRRRTACDTRLLRFQHIQHQADVSLNRHDGRGL